MEVFLSICITFFGISVLSFVSFALLAFGPCREAIVNLWWRVYQLREKASIAEAMDLAILGISAVYLKNGAISNLKLIRIAFVLNFLASIVWILSTIASSDLSLSEDMAEFSYPVLFFLGILGVYISERLAVMIFLQQHTKAESSKKLRFLLSAFIKVVAVIFVFLPVTLITFTYILATFFSVSETKLMVYGVSLTQWWAVGAVAAPLIEGLSPLYAFMALPAALSVFLPIAVYLAMISIALNPKLIHISERMLDAITTTKAKQYRDASVILVGVLGSVISVVPVAVELFT